MDSHGNGIVNELDNKRADILQRIRNGEDVALIARSHGLLPVHVHNMWKAELRRVAENDVKQEIQADLRKQQQKKEPELTNLRKLLLRANAHYEAGESARDVCAKVGVNYNTFHAWRHAERKQGRLPEGNRRTVKRRHSTQTPKAAKMSDSPYPINMPSRQGECLTCQKLETELRRVIGENIDLRIQAFRQG